MSDNSPLLRIAVPVPLRRSFDYLPPDKVDPTVLQPGIRVLVPFGSQKLVGILLETTTETGVERNRLKKAAAILDTQPILPADLLQHLGWASRYYHAPIGEVIQTALPVLLRQTRAAHLKLETVWTITPTGQQTDPTTLKRAPKQAVLLTRLQQDHTVSSAALNQQYSNWRQAMQKMVEAGWVEKHSVAASPVSRPVGEPRPLKTLNPDQHQAVEQMRATLGGFACHLLDGVTGSGKTEVYLNLIREVIAGDEQVLVLVPEIGLTPQLESRFRAALPCTVAVLHSGLNDTERLAAWLAAASGEAQVIIG
ncbi:MAG: DEAD/DEAH box helicase family protein, partial [Gammaproteobacteria bacterium]|nr:DEAD/DEAH box helicase family protein [Gammaproteobacteria bacterium]